MIDNYDNIVESLFTISYFLSLIFLFQQLYKVSKFFANRHSDYQSLLEFPNNYKFDSLYLNKNFDAISNELLVKDLDDFCIKNGIYNNRSVILSLSGGVDSMVTLACLLHLQKKYNNSFEIYTTTIDYSLRKESKYEVDFLKKYTKTMGVELVVASVEGMSRKKEGSGSRTEFEEGSRNLRFNTYKKIISDNNLSLNTGVLVGHHQDDIIENIFTNSMKGANLLDLEVMKEISTIRGINIYRPLLNCHKDVIYDLAHTYSIPYFLDTTPKWSRRGRMRNEIFVLFDNVFTKSWRNKLKDL